MPAASRPAFTAPFWIASTVNLLCLTGGSTFVLLPLYLERHGFHRWEIGLVAGSFSLMAVFSRPWVGERLDRRGRRPLFLAGAVLLGLLTFAFMAAPPSVPILMALRASQGLAMACYFTAIWTWTADYAPPGRMAEVLGLFGISGLVAGAAGPVLAELLAARGSFLPVFGVGGGLMLGAAWLALRLEEQRPRPLAEPPRSPGFWRLSLSPGLLGLTLVSLAFGGSTATFQTFAAPFVASRGLAGVGLFFTAYSVASVLVRLGAGARTDRLGPGRMVAPSLACHALGLAVFSRLGGGGPAGLPVLLAAALLAGTGHGLLYPALSSLAVQRVGAAHRGLGVSLFTGAIEFGSFAGALTAGTLAHATGYPETFLAGALAVGAAAGLFPLLEGRAAARGEDFPCPLP